MRYEDFYADYSAKEKPVKDAVTALVKLEKQHAKAAETGNVSELSDSAGKLKAAIETLSSRVAVLSDTLSSCDFKEYFNDGDFVQEMLSCCEKYSIDVVGEAPNFEMFPYKVRLDGENCDIYLNRKKYSTMRPEYFISQVKDNIDKLNRTSFNADKFAKELEAGYETVVKLSGKLHMGSQVELQSIYKAMTPMARSRSEYDLNAFTYDIARLYNNVSGVELKSGKKIVFGTARAGAKSIRILDGAGHEQLLGTVAFTE